MIKLSEEKIVQVKGEVKSGLISVPEAKKLMINWVVESFLSDMPIQARVAVRATKDTVAVEVLEGMLGEMLTDALPPVLERFKSICLLIHLIKGN